MSLRGALLLFATKQSPVNGGLLRRKNTVSQRHILRKIAPHAGVVKSVLRLFDELVKCDEEGVLKGVREVISNPVG